MNKPQLLPWDNPRFRNWIAVVRAEKAIVRELGKALAPLDLKLVQLDLLMNLYRHPGTSQHDLARRLLVGRSNITMLLPQLEKRGLLERRPCADDRRVLRLYLTDKGRETTLQAMEIQNALVARVMTLSSDDECAQVRDSMRRIVGLLTDDLDGKTTAA